MLINDKRSSNYSLNMKGGMRMLTPLHLCSKYGHFNIMELIMLYVPNSDMFAWTTDRLTVKQCVKETLLSTKLALKFEWLQVWKWF